MKIIKKKQDLILIVIILGAACLLFIGRSLLFAKSPGTMVEVSVDGKVVDTLPLGQDTDITIPGAGGGTNHLIIEHGEAYVDEASCPDKVCVHQGKIHRPGEMIVCLPNKMIAKIVGEDGQ